MLNSSKGLQIFGSAPVETRSDGESHRSRRDRSIIFKETLLDAALKNEFGFQERDILPLFAKYQSKRQILIDLISFLTYIVQLPTRLYLCRLRKGKYELKPSQSHFDWFTSSVKLFASKR